MMELRSRSHD